VVFADCFKNQPEGHALYKKVAITQLKPGTCGYFDQQGDLQQIVDLTKADELKEKGYSFVTGIKVPWILQEKAGLFASQRACTDLILRFRRKLSKSNQFFSPSVTVHFTN